jgi:hypothetical protein
VDANHDMGQSPWNKLRHRVLLWVGERNAPVSGIGKAALVQVLNDGQHVVSFSDQQDAQGATGRGMVEGIGQRTDGSTRRSRQEARGWLFVWKRWAGVVACGDIQAEIGMSTIGTFIENGGIHGDYLVEFDFLGVEKKAKNLASPLLCSASREAVRDIIS